MKSTVTITLKEYDDLLENGRLLHKRGIQIADLKNRLLQAQDRALRLQDRIKELEEVNHNYNKEICELKGQILEQLRVCTKVKCKLIIKK